MNILSQLEGSFFPQPLILEILLNVMRLFIMIYYQFFNSLQRISNNNLNHFYSNVQFSK